MTLSTWQLIVVGALAMIWIVVLGVPLVVDLLRWFRHRPPDQRHHAVPARARIMGFIQEQWWNRPRPLLAWRNQDIAQRRQQTLIGMGLLTTIGMFLAIALRGVFVQLFLGLVGVDFVLLAVAAFVGAAEYRTESDQAKARTKRRAPGRYELDLRTPTVSEQPASPPASAEERPAVKRRPTRPSAEAVGAQPDRSGFMFEPLNLGEALADRPDSSGLGDLDVDVPIDEELAAELGLPLDVSDVVDNNAGDDPHFRAAPEVGSRQASARARSAKKRRARPIYIESVLDEPEKPTKAVND